MKLASVVSLLCLTLGCYFLASSGYIHAKAIVAQYLIADAWHQTLATGKPQPPWSWADTYPVAVLRIADEDYFVLSGASGRTLAFGPGHMHGTALPGQPGNAVISAHRDTHFSALADVKINDVLHTQTLAAKARYKVTAIRIVEETDTDVIQTGLRSRLTLITCYPFNSAGLNPKWRYVVIAELVENTPLDTSIL